MSTSLSDNNDENDDHTDSRCYRCMTRSGFKWLADTPQTWPRTFSLLTGVILPLWCLIFLSLFFGYGLAKLEEPQEIAENNKAIGSNEWLETASTALSRLLDSLPKICAHIAFSGVPIQTLLAQGVALDEALSLIFDQVVVLDNTTFSIDELLPPLNETEVLVNTTEMSLFMTECNRKAQPFTDKVFDQTLKAFQDDSAPRTVTFNWVRCDGGQPDNKTSLMPDNQEAYATERWRESQRALYETYLKAFLADGTPPLEARSLAFNYSYRDANGFGDCSVNFVAGAWFWFTVMTTVGYGNTAPTTTGGRAMIYSLGFLSILAFAGVLASAGTIVATVTDDWRERLRIPSPPIPWAACTMWGIIYYSWMCVAAWYSQRWKQRRLGEDLSFQDAYWFSYITSTTVGLGDYYYDHSVLQMVDLIILPILFLTGYVCLAAFIVKFSAIVNGVFMPKGPSLEERLAKTRLVRRGNPSSSELEDITAEDGSHRKEGSPASDSSANAETVSYSKTTPMGDEAVVDTEEGHGRPVMMSPEISPPFAHVADS